MGWDRGQLDDTDFAGSLTCPRLGASRSGVSANERGMLGMKEGLILLSIGIEAPGHLVVDSARRLEAVGDQLSSLPSIRLFAINLKLP